MDNFPKCSEKDFATKSGKKVKIKSWHGLPCELETFWVNGKQAYMEDFGVCWDNREGIDMVEYMSEYGVESARYGCCNRAFREWNDANTEEHEKIKKALEELEIGYDDWLEITEQLEDVVAVGNCKWCE